MNKHLSRSPRIFFAVVTYFSPSPTLTFLFHSNLHGVKFRLDKNRRRKKKKGGQLSGYGYRTRVINFITSAYIHCYYQITHCNNDC